jgi:uncharacterized FlaG/YvyC family protein
MNGLGPIDGVLTSKVGAMSRPQTASTQKAAFSLPTDDTSIPASPPPEVLQALDRVQRVASELQARGLGVKFDVDETSKARVRVVDSKGGIVREIPVVRALDLLSGDQPLPDLAKA